MSEAVTEERPRRRVWRELPFLLLVALVLALVLKAFLVQAFFIPSTSMQNTLQKGDRVLVNKLVYDLRDIRRGEVVVFRANGSLAPESTPSGGGNPVGRAVRAVTSRIGLTAPAGETDYVKRVIGLPGDRVKCCVDGHVTVTPAGGEEVVLDEPYLFQDDHMSFCAAGVTPAACPADAEGVLVPKGRLFVMGDHRSDSGDSRIKYASTVNGAPDDGNNGTVSEDEVIGKATVTVWPLTQLDWLGSPDPLSGPSALGAGALGVLPLWLHRRRRRAGA